MRTLRAYSVSFVGVGRSTASAAGSYTARRPCLHHQVRKGEVVAPPWVDLGVVAAVQGVDRPVAAGDRAETRLLLAQPQLVAPVHALTVRSFRVPEPEPPADVRDLRVGEVRDEPSERVGRPRRVRVGERHDLTRGLSHGAVLRGDLPAARAVEEPDARLARGDRLDEFVRSGRWSASDATTISRRSAG